MAPIEHPGARLRSFRESLGLTLRQAAEQLHVSHPALRMWEMGQSVPSSPVREAIGLWSCGACPAEMWGLTPKEAKFAERLASVVPARPAFSPDDTGEHPVVKHDATGTEDA